MKIHPTAIVSPNAHLAEDVDIGPYCIVESDTMLGAGCVLESRATIKRGTTLGTENHLFEGAVLGGLPQHLHMPERPGRLVIGRGNTIRENVTIHRAMEDGAATVIGDENLIMVSAHVGHDAIIGNHVVLINNTMIAGHVQIEDKAYIAGGAGVAQFLRVGKLAAVGGQARVNRDVPPFVLLDGTQAAVVGLNKVGIRRAGYTSDDILQLKAAYRLIYRRGLTWREVLTELAREFPSGPAAEFHRFFAAGSRGFVQERRTPAAATIRLEANNTDDMPLRKVG